MAVSVFIGTSLDGFIARPNRAVDFLPRRVEANLMVMTNSSPAWMRW